MGALQPSQRQRRSQKPGHWITMNPASIRSCLSKSEERELQHIHSGSPKNEKLHEKLFTLGLIQHTKEGTEMTKIGDSVITSDEI